MRSFHATLNLTFDAHDDEEATAIALAAKICLEDNRFPYKVEVDADDVEEN